LFRDGLQSLVELKRRAAAIDHDRGAVLARISQRVGTKVITSLPTTEAEMR
jgi:hypothetical protein